MDDMITSQDFQNEIQETVEVWLKERGITSEQGPASSLDAKGNPYVAFAQGLVKEEGTGPTLSYSFVDSEMVHMALHYLRHWLEGRAHIIWRTYPCLGDSLKVIDGVTFKVYYIYFRLTAY